MVRIVNEARHDEFIRVFSWPEEPLSLIKDSSFIRCQLEVSRPWAYFGRTLFADSPVVIEGNILLEVEQMQQLDEKYA
jgi:hypothetical protein